MRISDWSSDVCSSDLESVEEVRAQLLRADGVLVWVNPIEAGRDRSILNGLLEEVAEAGVLVSAHPNAIRKMGTKEVLYRTLISYERRVGQECVRTCRSRWSQYP